MELPLWASRQMLISQFRRVIFRLYVSVIFSTCSKTTLHHKLAKFIVEIDKNPHFCSEMRWTSHRCSSINKLYHWTSYHVEWGFSSSKTFRLILFVWFKKQFNLSHIDFNFISRIWANQPENNAEHLLPSALPITVVIYQFYWENKSV